MLFPHKIWGTVTWDGICFFTARLGMEGRRVLRSWDWSGCPRPRQQCRTEGASESLGCVRPDSCAPTTIPGLGRLRGGPLGCFDCALLFWGPPFHSPSHYWISSGLSPSERRLTNTMFHLFSFVCTRRYVSTVPFIIRLQEWKWVSSFFITCITIIFHTLQSFPSEFEWIAIDLTLFITIQKYPIQWCSRHRLHHNKNNLEDSFEWSCIYRKKPNPEGSINL